MSAVRHEQIRLFYFKIWKSSPYFLSSTPKSGISRMQGPQKVPHTLTIVIFVCFCVYKSKTYSFIRFIGIKVFEYLFIQIYVMENCNSYCEIFYTQSLIRFDIYFTLSSLSLYFFLLWERKSFICCHSLLLLFCQKRWQKLKIHKKSWRSKNMWSFIFVHVWFLEQ